jgi:acyl-CoA reductase-like NAD-dependent aldehyde dehydrogenase
MREDPMTVETTTDHATLDAIVADLNAHAGEWVALPFDEKVALLERLRPRIMAEADAMVRETQRAKGIDASSSWGAEDWITGPWAFLQGTTALLTTLHRVQKGAPPVETTKTRTRTGGQTVVSIFPATPQDSLLLSGYGAEVWMMPGVSRQAAVQGAAAMYRGEGYADPGVALVLGAGNVGTITTLDILHMLYTEGSVCVVKMNPVNDYLSPHFAEIFAEFIERGWLRFVHGGPDVGGYLAHHEGVHAVHMTGSAATHDANVWGVGPAAEARRASGERLLVKPITSELGGVSPMIVVGGEWTNSDLQFQAEHLVTSKLNNAGHNCIATQVIVVPESWPQADALLDRVRAVIAALPPRPQYYPRAAAKVAAAVDGHASAEHLGRGDLCTLVPDLSVQGAESLVNDEVFAGAMGVVRLPGTTTADYLRNAVAFANDVLPGTLGASIVIDPATAKRDKAALDTAIADLRYGSIGINAWTGLNFLLGYTPWGAFPGHTEEEIGSGIGFVHNAFLLQDVQKGVAWMPFRPLHRSALSGQLHMSPKPPFFVTNKTGATTARRLSEYLATGNHVGLVGIFASALRG